MPLGIGMARTRISPEKVRMIQLRRAIWIESNTRLKFTVSILGVINQEYGQNFVNKAQALAFMNEMLGEKDWQPRSGDEGKW